VIARNRLSVTESSCFRHIPVTSRWQAAVHLFFLPFSKGKIVRSVRTSTKSEVALDLRGALSYAPNVSEFLALVELGSNAVRCLVASILPGVGFQILHEERAQTRLSAGRPGLLPPTAIRETTETIRRFLREARREYQPHILAVATSAVRDATNRKDLLEKLQREAGVSVRILSGLEEALLGTQAALRSLSLRNGTVADLGGGSLQLSHVREGEITSAASLPLGSVRTTTRFFKNDPPTEREVQILRQEVQHQLAKHFSVAAPSNEMIGLGGTIRTLGRMHLTAINKQRSRQGLSLQRTDISVLRERMEKLPARERVRLGGLKEERADVILAGTVVVEEVMRLGNYRTLTVCTEGVRQGLLLRETFGRGI
jgi:exopolyphosphatase / guanosine-5'-triphosphate,3'-diphosphate pyrophosphatase